LSRPTRSIHSRKAAINASTVFAITLAIIAGLICAWVFKTVFLTPKKTEAPKPPKTERLTVLAANVTENSSIASTQVKRITVPKEEFDDAKGKEKDRGKMLTGSQPIGRVPKVPLKAEEPIYENDLVPLRYPTPLKIASGMVPATVDVPTRGAALARVDDRVDLLCTLTNTDPDLGPTETRTAVMARNVKVLARFNTTSDAARPTETMMRNGTRPYTLEVTPYRGGLIELSKQLGAAFALRPHAKDDTGLATTVSAKAEEMQDPDVDRVTTDDLVKLFGFTKPLATRYYEIEKFSGVDQVQGAHIFLEPGSPQPAPRTSNQSPGQGRPPGSGGGLQGPGMRGMPGGGGPPPNGGQQAPPGGGRQAAITGTVDSHLSAANWRRVNVESSGNGSGVAPGQAAAAQSGVTDYHLASSGWRRVNAESGGPSGMMASNRGFGGLNPGGMGSLARAGGGLGGPSMGYMGLGSGMGASPDCPNCGRKR
jgi:Flp pilus assembly protein CpaB